MATKKKPQVEEKEFIDIDLSPIKKTKFRIDGDSNRILELNLQDMKMPSRLNETIPKLEELSEKYSNMSVDDLDELSKDIVELDKEMRGYIDYIFDSNVSEVTAPFGTMFDMIGGKFRCEYILDVMTKLYSDTIQKEADLLNKQMLKHTAKYKK